MQNYLLSFFSLESFLLYSVFINLKQKQKIKLLHNTIEEKEKSLIEFNKNFDTKLAQATEDTVLKCDEFKLLSLKEMITNISHQWRQPLSTISLIATTIEYDKKENKLQDETMLNFCSIINKNVQYLSQVIDLFDSSLCTKKEKSVFQLDSLITALYQLKIGNIEIIDSAKNNISVYSYKKDLLQVLINIANNSKDIFDKRDIEDRYLFIETLTENNNFIIDIKDTGGGMGEKIIHRVFEPYFTTKHQSQGTGLGLYSAYLTVSKKLGGSITVQNTHFVYKGEEYVGARFIIKAPKS